MTHHDNHSLKTLRDKLNGSIQHDEDEEVLQEEWNRTHAEMEALKAEDERNYVEFGR
ncbi:hypothetical protein [Acinetobacter sp. CFCC 11171]|uniref:hypothetical protein n=1 Tax=Acinetobacter sp. CFCC 11171 TaxID=1775558 RepID=UPI00148DE66F|nr:hypothetical protein [Acinetobacter sp. CFCC 11171]